jgi:hypothetical protein
MRRHGGRIGHHLQFRQVGRGGTVPPFWFGPSFHVRNYGLYGFPQPFQGGRWVRYYDDALLIDRDGRVHDSRPGYDWDRYGERWSYGEDGIPEYAGDRDYAPGDGDYEYAEDYGRDGDDYAYDGPPPPPMPRGYGYGYGPVVVTETITTTDPVYEEVITYEDAPSRVHVKPRHRAKPAYRAPAPRHGGERG